MPSSDGVGQLGKYKVNFESQECTCKDYVWRGQACKHYFAALIYLSRNFSSVLDNDLPELVKSTTMNADEATVMSGRRPFVRKQKRGPKRKNRRADFGFGSPSPKKNYRATPSPKKQSNKHPHAKIPTTTSKGTFFVTK